MYYEMVHILHISPSKIEFIKMLQILGKLHIFVLCLTSSVDGLIVHDLIKGTLNCI